jgi:hypothetical protein
MGNPSVNAFEIRLYPHHMLETISQNRWPETITLHEYPIKQSQLDQTLQQTKLQIIVENMITRHSLNTMNQTNQTLPKNMENSIIGQKYGNLAELLEMHLLTMVE